VAAPVNAAVPEAERAPRKRRRRRGGKRIEGGAEVAQQAAANVVSKPPSRQVKPVKPAAKPATTGEASSLFSRIGQGLKKLVTRAPRTQH
jgi:ATP-dependent RNA helicase RhlB